MKNNTLSNIILFSLLLVLNNLTSYAQSSNQNYVQTRTPLVPVATVTAQNALTYKQQQITIQYFDGLGRPLQTVQKQATTNAKDIVQPFEYDAYGREVKKYLPYSNITGSQDGSYKTNALTAGQGVWAHYKLTTQSIDTTSFPFSETIFEASPLNRTIENGAPGKAFRVLKNTTGSTLLGNTVKTEYGTNIATEVKLWTVTTTGATSTANYGVNQLYKTTLKDENWKAVDGVHGTIQEFKDKEGKVVLKRTFNKNSAGATETLSTYYVYDNFGNLRYVLPPAVTVSSFIETDAQFKDLMYGYHYDSRQRVVEKKLPGKGWEYIIYNKLDQVVFTQDSVQRTKKQWSFNKYDAMGRVIMSGLANNDGQTRQAVQTSVNNQTLALWEDRDASTLGYTTRTYPNTSATSVEILMINYYDDYTFAVPTGYNYVADTLNVQGCMSNGLLTASKIKVLDGTANYLWTVNYYDKEGRLIQQHKQNYIGGKDVVNTKYSFTGQPLVVKRVHTNGKGINAQTFLYWYQYDHMDRKKRVLHKVINGTINATAQPVILIDYAYNELGQLIAKKLHSIDKGVSYAQVVDYQYTSQGWLKKINDLAQISATSADKADKFGLELKYDDSSSPQYNGNIANMVWRGTKFSAPTMEYTFGYDKQNRLLKAKSLQGGNYEERIDGYDLMGNILKLSRMSNNDLIDSLVYTYKVPNLSNQLDRVDEKSGSTNKTLGFNEIGSIQQAGEYSYDANGNMLTDKNAGITTNIVYNHLNLPQTIVKGTTTINYLYDALGRKLRKTVGTTIDDYVDGLQLQTVGNTTTIKFIATEEGRANWNGASNPYYYHYDLKDHLGNIRVTINEAGTVLQEDSYYAFGMQMSGKSFNATNKYLYNGKEIQTETGWYDHGARQYNPVLGRWNVVDPLTEKMRRHSPYTFVFNNPLRFLDQDGMVGNDWIKNIRTNEVKWEDDINEFTRFAANSEWQYFGKAGTTYFTANGTRQVILGDNGHWDYVSDLRNLNWGEFTSQVNELKPMLDATATGSLIAVYGLAAVSGGGFAQLGWGTFGNFFGDASLQMAMGKGSFQERLYNVNIAQSLAVATFKVPITGAGYGSAFQFSYGNQFKQSLVFGNKSTELFAVETIMGGIGGSVSVYGMNNFQKYNPGLSSFVSGYLTTIAPSWASTQLTEGIKYQYNFPLKSYE